MYAEIKAGAYRNTKPWPTKAEYDKFYVYHRGTVIENGIIIFDHDERDAKREEWTAAGYTFEQLVDHAAMDAAKVEYQDEEERLMKKFQDDITEHFGFTGHPRAAVLFNIAWERGHGNGFGEVFNIYQNLSSLLDPVPDLKIARRQMFAAYSECLNAGHNMTVDEIADKLLAVVR